MISFRSRSNYTRRIVFFILLVIRGEHSFSNGLVHRTVSATEKPRNSFRYNDLLFRLPAQNSAISLQETRNGSGSSNSRSESLTSSTVRDEIKDRLMKFLSSTPSNAPTSQALTNQIISVIKQLESQCPTPDSQVLEQLGGNWELVWTAQDRTSPEWSQGPLLTWINPLENQAYSNNPRASTRNGGLGRTNPVLPLDIQDGLEKTGIMRDAGVIRSSQSINLDKGLVRNVVSFSVAGRRSSLTVTVSFRPNPRDPRRVDVKFQQCRCAVASLDFTIPLGIFGPTGWLRTVYIDDEMRVTRGHKGSVFVLSRTKSKGTSA